jgi:hypothetical protein
MKRPAPDDRAGLFIKQLAEIIDKYIAAGKNLITLQ